MDSELQKQYFSIVFISKGRHNFLRKAVKAVYEQIYQYKNVEIVVIEETNTPEQIALNNVRYFSIPERNFGFGFVRQLALEMTKGSINIFIDDDVIPHQNWFINLIKPFNDQNIGAVGGAILPDISKINIIGKSISFLGFPAGGLKRYIEADGMVSESKEISTGNCAFRTELAWKIGGFDKVLKWGGEDQEFFGRMSQKAKTLYNPHAIVFHKQRNSVKKVFHWFVRRGKAEFFMKCKSVNPLHALVFPLRSNFIVKLFFFCILFMITFRISIVLALSFFATAGLFWNYILWARLCHHFKNHKCHQLPYIIENIKSVIISGNVKWIIIFVKFTMDLGLEVGKISGFLRFLNHRIFIKPIILTFHHLGAPSSNNHSMNSKYYFPIDKFQTFILDCEKDGRFIVPVSDILRRLRECPNTLFFERLLSISFDDGYESIYEPLKNLALDKNYQFTVFIPTKCIGDVNNWDVKKGLEIEPIMNWDQILSLSALGTEFGSHTCSHVNLVDINGASQKNEIVDSYQVIKSHSQHVQYKEILFSYPYGNHESKFIKILKNAGYAGAVTNYQGNIRLSTNRWLIPRFTIFSTSEWSSISKQSRSYWATDILRDLRDFIFHQSNL